MPQIPGLKVLFVAGFGPIVSEPAKSKQFYVDVLGLPLEAMEHDPTYYHGEKLDGVKHFALWPLKSAAEAVFGTSTWPGHVPTPNAWIEFDVEDVPSATDALKKQGYKLLVEARQEPWGQTVTRLMSPDGLLVGVTFTPWMRGK